MPRTSRRGMLAGTLLLGALTILLAWCSSRTGTPATAVHSGAVAPATTWFWDGAAWVLQPPAGGAGPSSSRSDMAYDPLRTRVVLWDHGCTVVVTGFTGGCRETVDATWSWDGRAWTRQPAAASPRESGMGTMAFVRRVGGVVYVNGLGQAWAWTGTTWAPLARDGAPAVVPPGSVSRRSLSAYAAGYDEARDLLVVMQSDRTWTWDGARWSSVAGGVGYAEGGADPRLAFDRTHQRLVHLGRRATWSWDGATWSPGGPPPPGPGSLGFDPGSGRLLYVQASSDCDRSRCRVATWAWDGATWTPVPVDGPANAFLPATRSGNAPPPVATDGRRGGLLLFVSGA